ncbi:MAG: hypothetical protein ACI4HM_02405 [Ruminococcus sp.]
MKTCKRCGNSISENATICPICGEGRVAPKNKFEKKLSCIKPVQNTEKPKKRLMAFLLSWIGFGLGYYYLGYQDKFIHRASIIIKAMIAMITIIGAPYGILLLFYYVGLSLYDMVYLTFINKYDAYGNEIKLI